MTVWSKMNDFGKQNMTVWSESMILGLVPGVIWPGTWSRRGSGTWSHLTWYLESAWAWYPTLWIPFLKAFSKESEVCWFRRYLVPGVALVILARRPQAGH